MKKQTREFLLSVFYKELIEEAATELTKMDSNDYTNIHLNHGDIGEIHVSTNQEANTLTYTYTADLVLDPECRTGQQYQTSNNPAAVAQALYNCAYAHQNKKPYNPEKPDAPFCTATLYELLGGMGVNIGWRLEQHMKTLPTTSNRFLIATMLEAATDENKGEINNRITRLLLEDAMATLMDYSDNELTDSGLPVSFLGIHAQSI